MFGFVVGELLDGEHKLARMPEIPCVAVLERAGEELFARQLRSRYLAESRSKFSFDTACARSDETRKAPKVSANGK